MEQWRVTSAIRIERHPKGYRLTAGGVLLGTFTQPESLPLEDVIRRVQRQGGHHALSSM